MSNEKPELEITKGTGFYAYHAFGRTHIVYMEGPEKEKPVEVVPADRRADRAGD